MGKNLGVSVWVALAQGPLWSCSQAAGCSCPFQDGSLVWLLAGGWCLSSPTWPLHSPEAIFPPSLQQMIPEREQAGATSLFTNSPGKLHWTFQMTTSLNSSHTQRERELHYFERSNSQTYRCVQPSHEKYKTSRNPRGECSSLPLWCPCPGLWWCLPSS